MPTEFEKNSYFELLLLSPCLVFVFLALLLIFPLLFSMRTPTNLPSPQRIQIKRGRRRRPLCLNHIQIQKAPNGHRPLRHKQILSRTTFFLLSWTIQYIYLPLLLIYDRNGGSLSVILHQKKKGLPGLAHKKKEDGFHPACIPL